MSSMRVVAVMLDGTKHEAVGVYMALADRIAFERLYDVSVLEVRRQTQTLDPETGEPTAESRVNALREEQTAYFVWCTLTRGECPIGGFEDFIGNVEDITLDRQVGPVDPTDLDPLPGTSPS